MQKINLLTGISLLKTIKMGTRNLRIQINTLVFFD